MQCCFRILDCFQLMLIGEFDMLITCYECELIEIFLSGDLTDVVYDQRIVCV